MSGNALPTDGRFRFVASDRTGRPWITLFVLRGVHAMGTGSATPVGHPNSPTSGHLKIPHPERGVTMV